MRRWLTRVLTGCALLLATAATAGAIWQFTLSRRELASTVPPGSLVDVGSHRLHIWCRGMGTPTVILESGLAGSAFEWGDVQAQSGNRRRTCAYDRAGLGYSEPGPRPRTSRQIVRELVALLDGAGITEPVVAVGQSFGGFNARILASEHPHRVAGLVLVDTSHEDQRRRFAEAGVSTGEPPRAIPHLVPFAAWLGITRLIGFGAGINPAAIAPEVRRYADSTRFQTKALRAAASEYLAVAQSSAQVRESRRTLNIPLIVLSRTRERDEASGRVHQAMQADQATISTRSCRMRVPDAGHLIQVDQPSVVVAAIEEVIAAADTGRTPTCAPSSGGRHVGTA